MLAGGIESSDGGAPVPKGSGVAAHRIAPLLEGGIPIDELLADYPWLTRAQVEAAKAYAETHPNPGRPCPRITVKRALRGAGLEALDGLLEDEPRDADAAE